MSRVARASARSGEPIRETEHVARDLPYGPISSLHEVILRPCVLEVLCPPARAIDLRFRTAGLP